MTKKQTEGQKRHTAALKLKYPYRTIPPKDDFKYLVGFVPQEELEYSGYNLAIYMRMRKRPK